MKFNNEGFVYIRSMNREQAQAFILFLLSERQRHLDDVKIIDKRIGQAAKRFGLTVTPLEEMEAE